MLARPSSLFVVGGLWAIGVDFSHYMARWCGVNLQIKCNPGFAFSLYYNMGSMPFFSHLGGSSSILGTSSETPASLSPHPIFGSCCEVCKRSSTNCRCSLGSCEHIVTLAVLTSSYGFLVLRVSYQTPRTNRPNVVVTINPNPNPNSREYHGEYSTS